jgi:hypothetical protein
MLERIVVHEVQTGGPDSPFDFGLLAEAMIFYGHTHLVISRSQVAEVLATFGVDTLAEYLRAGHMTMAYVPNMLAVVSRDGLHDLGLVRISGGTTAAPQPEGFYDVVERRLRETGADPSWARHSAQTLAELTKEMSR